MTTEVRPVEQMGSGMAPAWAPEAVLLDALAAAVVATDTEGRIFYFNGAAERLYGYTREQMIGANILSLFVDAADRNPAQEIMTEVMDGHRWSGPWRVRRSDGGLVAVWATDTPILDGDRVVGVIGVAEAIPDESIEPATAAATAARALAVAEQMRHALESR